jgi:hypothetical protein
MFIITRNTLADFGCDSIGELVIAMSKIAALTCRKGSYPHTMIYHALFGHQLESKGNILDNIVRTTVPKLVRYDFQALANIAIGFARIGLNPKLDDGSTLFDRIATHAVTRFPSNPRQRWNQFTPGLLSNAAWAFAKVKQSNPALFKMIAEESIQQMARFNSQEISITLWAFVHTGEQYKKHNKTLYKKAAERIVQCVSALTPEALGDIAYSFALIRNRHHPVFDSIGNEAVRKLGSFTPHNLSKIVWAYTSGRVSHPTLFEEVAKKAAAYKTVKNQMAMVVKAKEIWRFQDVFCPGAEELRDLYYATSQGASAPELTNNDVGAAEHDSPDFDIDAFFEQEVSSTSSTS